MLDTHRDSKFTAQFNAILKAAGVKPVPICYQAPNMNAFAERWVLSVKSECLNRMILLGTDSLRRALKEYEAHFHTERPHQGLGNELIESPAPTPASGDRVVERERLGGLLRTYQRAA